MLSTERLVLRRWRPDDLDPYAELCADPEVMRWIGNGGVRTREECAKAISAFERAWDDRGFGLFAMELRASGGLAGFVGLSVPDCLAAILSSVEIGWRLAADQWGKGLATASGRIMEKLGMRLERETVDPSCGRPVRVCEITRLGWEARGRGVRP